MVADLAPRDRWSDVVSGLCVAGLLLPEAVAYSGLAHLPVGHALMALVVGLAIYAFSGRSRFAIVAPTSSTAALLAAAALSIAGGFSGESALHYAQVVMALTLLCGVMLMVLAFARQGQLSSFISRPVLKGFAFALAITIVVKQMPDALGFDLPSTVRSDPFNVFVYVATHASTWHLPSVAIALTAAAMILALRRWPKIPASMLVIVLFISAAMGFDFAAMGVREIGEISIAAIQPTLPHLPWAEWMHAGELAFGLVMLVFAESWGSMRTMALAHGDPLDANHELMVLGACNAGAALLQGMPVGAGFSATSANSAAGAVSKKSGLFALLVIVLAIVFALPLLKYLPRPVLAVAVISALWHALSIQPMLSIWTMRRDRTLLVGAIFAVLLLGVLNGMLVSIGLSVLDALRRFSQPVVHELGKLGSSRDFVDVNAHHGASATQGVLILRPEVPLFFGSAERVMLEILKLSSARDQLNTVILSLEESADLDSTAVDCLMELRLGLHRMEKTLLLARVKTVVRDLLAHCDPQELGSQERMFWSVADAADFAAARLTPATSG
ncbi:MAG: SulP family inorganic anion transporter [Rhodoferax sp.]